MRIESNPYVNANKLGAYAARSPQTEAAGFSLDLAGTETRGASGSAGDSVQISQRAREAFAAYAWGQSAGTEEKEDTTREDFLSYMEESRKAEKSTKEKIENLKKKLDKIKEEMSRTVSDEKMPEPIKKAKIQNLTSQMNQIIIQISDLSTQLAQEEAAESSGDFFAGV